jgi:hypothetical protein
MRLEQLLAGPGGARCVVIITVLEIALLIVLIFTSNAWTVVQGGGWVILPGALLGAWLARPTCTQTPFTLATSCTTEHFPVFRITYSSTPGNPLFQGSEVVFDGAFYMALVFCVAIVVIGIAISLIRGKRFGRPRQ